MIQLHPKGWKKLPIDTAEVFKQLRKHHGEQVAKDVRDAHLDDIPNIVHILEFAGKNPVEIRELFPALREIYKMPTESEYVTDRSPLELLDMAGYYAWYVTNEQEQNAIAGYFRDTRSVEHGMTNGNARTDKNELLCTVGQNWDDGRQRFDDNYIINAVKKEALGDDKLPESEWHIKPSETPERQDEYGTSVISIQISKQGGYISIKNRYNHTVTNPDATFNNNPDNIIPGLSDSIQKHFNIEFGVVRYEIPEQFRMVHDQFLRFNYEVENVCFDENYYFQGSTITKIDKNSQMILDYFVLDKKNKCLLNPAKVKDPAFDILAGLINGKPIKDVANPDNPKEKIIYADGIRVAAVQGGKITELNLPNVTELGDGFLQYNDSIKRINIPSVKKIGNFFLNTNTALTEINAPSLQETGTYFLNANTEMHTMNTPKLQRVGNGFLYHSRNLTELNLPELETVGISFLHYNEKLAKLNAPKLRTVGSEFLGCNNDLETLYLPSLEKIEGYGFLTNNQILKSISLPRLKSVGDDFLRENVALTELTLPELTNAGRNFLVNNKQLKLFSAPHLKMVSDNFLMSNQELRELSLPELTYVYGGFFLYNNTDLEKIYVPQLYSVGISFLGNNKKMEEFDAPMLTEADGPLFLMNHVLKKVNVPRLKEPRRNELAARIIRNATQRIFEPEPVSETPPQPKLDLTVDEFFAGWDRRFGGNGGNTPV